MSENQYEAEFDAINLDIENEVKAVETEKPKAEKPKTERKPIALSDSEKQFLQNWLNKFKNSNSLNDNQKYILNLSNKDKNTISEIKELKVLLKAEKVVFDRNEKKQKIINEALPEMHVFVDLLMSGAMLDESMGYSFKDVFETMVKNGMFKNASAIKKLLDEV